MKESSPQIAEFILCEDIREEVNGKVSLIGLYRDELSFLDGGDTRWPRALRHAVFIRVRHLPSERINITLKVEHEGTNLFEFGGPYEVTAAAKKGEVNVNANLAINVPGLGELLTRLSIENKKGEVLLEATRSLHIVQQKQAEGQDD